MTVELVCPNPTCPRKGKPFAKRAHNHACCSDNCRVQYHHARKRAKLLEKVKDAIVGELGPLPKEDET